MVVVESRRPVYDQIVETVEKLVENADPTTAANQQRQLNELKESWENVHAQANEENEKLKEALENAKELEEKTGSIDFWLTRVEGTISLFEDPSTILETLQKQRVSYKVCARCAYS
jgi:methyl-accepting chemotaxis protein